MNAKNVFYSRVLLFTFVMPLIIGCFFNFFDVPFIPSVNFMSATITYSYIHAATMIFLIFPLIKAQKKSSHKMLFILFIPMFSFFISHSFLFGPVAYTLHELTAPENTEKITETVRDASRGNKYCRNKIVLSNSPHSIFPRQICQASTNDVDTLRYGGRIVLFGTRSNYGFVVTRHSPVAH